MKQQVTLEGEEVRVIIAKYFGIPVERVIPMRYSYAIEGISPEEIEKKIEASED